MAIEPAGKDHKARRPRERPQDAIALRRHSRTIEFHKTHIVGARVAAGAPQHGTIEHGRAFGKLFQGRHREHY